MKILGSLLFFSAISICGSSEEQQQKDINKLNTSMSLNVPRFVHDNVTQNVTVNCDTQNHNHNHHTHLEAQKNRSAKIKAAYIAGGLTLLSGTVAAGVSLAIYYSK